MRSFLIPLVARNLIFPEMRLCQRLNDSRRTVRIRLIDEVADGAILDLLLPASKALLDLILQRFDVLAECRFRKPLRDRLTTITLGLHFCPYRLNFTTEIDLTAGFFQCVSPFVVAILVESAPAAVEHNDAIVWVVFDVRQGFSTFAESVVGYEIAVVERDFARRLKLKETSESSP